MSPASTFELLRFEATPVSAGVALVELGGHFTGPEPVRPRLLIEADNVASEHPAVQARVAPDVAAGVALWSAVFAVPLRALSDPDATFDLHPGRGPLVALPHPTPAGDEDERLVELARTANDLRHRLGEATDVAAAADGRVAEIAAERDRLAEELEQAKVKLAAAETRVEESHAAALEARESQAGAEGEAEQAQAALARAREEARAAVQAEIDGALAEAQAARTQLTDAQDRAIAAEDEARAARRQLVEARARIEALAREQKTAQLHAARRERVHTPSRRVTDEDEDDFRASRLGPDWAEGLEEGEEHEGEDETAQIEAEVEPEEAVEEQDGDEDEDEHDEDETQRLRAVGDDDTAAFEAAAGDPATTARLEALEEQPRPGLWKDDDEGVRVLRPRTPGARRLPPVRPLGDEQVTGDEAILAPPAVGARMIKPAETTPRHRAIAILTSPRTVVATIFVLLIVALVLIFSGVGPV